jgi:hypothetical protein
MKKVNLMWLFLPLVFACSCQKELIEYGQGNVKVQIEQGEKWLHDFPLFMGIKKKNPPQIAVWIEDLEGNYLSTVYVTHKAATQSWQSAGGNRRKEALPVWSFARGAQTDGISGATPLGSFNVKLVPAGALKQFVVKIEVNQSTDFNEQYPKTAKEGEAGYSGGEMGSGQPALVYAATVDLSSGNQSYEAVLIGHSSADGSTGDISDDLSGLTTALQIVKHINITIQ